MGRLSDIIAKQQDQDKRLVDEQVETGAVEVMDFKPDNIPQEVWDLILENGELATRRLNEILTSPRFHRLRAGDQAKLIALAQNRAYGLPATQKSDASKRVAGASDVTQSELQRLTSRAALPEYRRNAKIEDAEIMDDD